MPRHALLAAALVLAACGTSGPSRTAPATPASARHTISYTEIQSSSLNNAYDLVRQLRPFWLQMRGRGLAEAGDVVVYLDAMPLGGVASLSQISLVDVRTIRHLDAGTATSRWGRGHAQGAILVSTALGPHR